MRKTLPLHPWDSVYYGKNVKQIITVMLEESSLLCAESESICLPRVSKGLPEEKVFESRPEQGRIYHLGPQVLPRL